MKRVLIVLLGILLFSVSHAQNIIRPKIACPNDLWVNSYNGVLFFARTDMQTMNSALPMQLQFYYNSSYASKNYGYGAGFSLGYEIRYEMDSLGIIIERGDGRRDLFTRYDNLYKASAGVFDQLTQPEEGKFLLSTKEGTRYFFDDSRYGLVTKITDRNNNSTLFTYQDSLLTQIADEAGRAITLTYTNGRLTRTSATFSKGNYSYQYDNKGRLIKITNPMGYSTLYSYDQKDRLNGITDANGNKTEIQYNATGAVSRVKTAVTDKVIRYEKDILRTVVVDYTEPATQFSYYFWDEKGRVIEKSGSCCGIQEKLEYDDDDNVIKRTDANGNVRSFTYDKNGNMLSATDPEGHTERYTYEPVFNQIASFTDKRGNSFQFSYDERGNLTEITGPEGYNNSYSYTRKGLLQTETDANGNVTVNNFSDTGLLLSQTDAAGNERLFTYDIAGNLLTSKDARGYTTTFSYDNINRLTSVADPLKYKTGFSYDRLENIVRIKDPLNRITANTYNALGQLLTTTDPAGKMIRYLYNGKVRPVALINQLNDTTKIAYDGNDRIIRITNPANETTSLDYDAKGNLIALIQPNGNIIGYEYTPNDWVKTVFDQIGVISTNTYDANGNVLSQEDGEGRKTTYSYDDLNRINRMTDALGNSESYTYDGNSNILFYINRNGHSETYSYDALDRLLEVTDALNNKTNYEYDGEGNLVKAVDARNNATSYTYDALGRNTHITFANGTVNEFGYDAIGNVIRMKDRNGSEIKYTYDVLNQLLSVLYPDQKNKHYNYNAIGQLVGAMNENAVVTLDYDKAGRIIRETLNEKVTGYSYDIANRKRTLIYPGHKQIEEVLNVRDQITRILEDGTEIASIAHNQAGQMVSRAYNNGITTAFGYNENGWINQITEGTIRNVLLMYDKAGNILSSTDILKPEYSEQYVYDELDRLIQFNKGTITSGAIPDPLKSIEYQYDALGNRTTVKTNGIARVYTANAMNEYTAISGDANQSFQYDRNGNLLSDQTHTYHYDFDNNLIRVDDDNTASYLYDALGRRIAKINDGQRTNFYYAGDQIIEERNGSDDIVATYIFGEGIDDILKMNRNGEAYYYHKNHLGSVMSVTDSQGKVKESYQYDPFGKVSFLDASGNSIASTQIGNSILFTGRWYDEETGTYYYRARTMHPGLGRFIQPDPLGHMDGVNYYTYALNNSLNYTDPLGLFSIRDINPEWCKQPSNNCKEDFDWPSEIEGLFDSLNETMGNIGQVLETRVYKGRFGRMGAGINKGVTRILNIKFAPPSGKVYPGAGYKRIGRGVNVIGKRIGYLGKVFEGMSLVSKWKNGRATLCDVIDFGIGWDPFSSAFTLGWDFGTWLEDKTHFGEKTFGRLFDFAFTTYYDFKYR
ncbi:MAG: hypothetical protein LIO93_01095 [Bacteroidales bacterium]|nr:hypothetical protein [Bacteroidales bacterium]